MFVITNLFTTATNSSQCRKTVTDYNATWQHHIA